MRQVALIDWSVPGENRFTGPVAKAIATYDDIPKHIRDKLITRAAKREYSEIVTIDAQGIRGEQYEYVNLRQMFFGVNIRAEKVNRSAWPYDLVERGFVYTEDKYTILIPFICTNVARVDKTDKVDHQPGPYFAPTPQVRQVPEPTSALAVGTALICLIIQRRMKCKTKYAPSVEN